MIPPNEFWLQLHHLALAYENEGSNDEQRGQNIIKQFQNLPPSARQAVLSELTVVAVSIRDLYSSIVATNGNHSPQDELLDYLDQAITITAADMGNVQLVDAEGGLRITVQRGFKQPFLDFFSCVKVSESCCGLALRRGQRVVVDDVTTSPVFANRESQNAMLTAGARACQSTPLLSESGQVLGVLSTHFHAPTQPSDSALRQLDALAARAARFIEQRATVG